MNLCINCRHHEAIKRPGAGTSFSFLDHQCHAFDGGENPVDGSKITGATCDSMRLGSLCGIEGKFYAPVAAEDADAPSQELETDDAYRKRLLLAIGPHSIYTEEVVIGVGERLDNIGLKYEIPRKGI